MAAGPQRPRVALIGISGYGRIHLQLARECRDRGELDITAAAVINPAEETDNVAELRAKGCAIYPDYEQMLREHAGKIDLCLIPTGIHWHSRMTLAALHAGANVLVEKPLASSLAEVNAIRAAERATGKFVAVGFQDYYDPGTAWLKAELQRGTIGQVKSVRFLGLWPRQRSYFTRNNWAGRKIVDGIPVLDSPLNNAFAHFVMLSLFFAGATTATAADAEIEGAELFRAHEIDNFDTGVVTLRSREGVGLWFGATHASRQTLEPEINIIGASGTACWRYENEAWLKDAAGQLHRRALTDQTETRRAMMSAVLRRLSDPTYPICTSEMAGLHTKVIETLSRTRQVASFPVDWVQWHGVNGNSSFVPEVRGLDTALRQAFAEQKLLSECGFAPLAAARK